MTSALLERNSFKGEIAMAELVAEYLPKDAVAAVIFVHGLGGHPRETWMSDARTAATFWPIWLADEVPSVGIWTLGYDAELSAWINHAMPLADQGISVLETLHAERRLAGKRLILVGHSLGGLVIKTLLSHGMDQGVQRYQVVVRRIRGIAFVGTPHNGSNIANLARAVSFILRTNDQVRDLQAHDSLLRALHGRFLNYREQLGIKCRTYCETRGIRASRNLLFRFISPAIVVVNESSAEPNIPKERAIPLPEDHSSIAKPTSRSATLFRSLVEFVIECLAESDGLTECTEPTQPSAPSAQLPALVAGPSQSPTAPPPLNLIPGQILHTLRAPVPDFIERSELQELRTYLTDAGAVIAGIQGMGGVGKSELARRVASELVLQYPDAQFEIDLLGSGVCPRTPEEAMTLVLRSIYPNAALPVDIAELQPLYAQALRTRRVLLLLDNARDASQVIPLLPPPGSVALITSRQRFTLPGLHTVSLGRLSSEEALQLASKIAGQRQGFAAHSDRLVQLCDRWALAIRVTCSAIVETRAIPIETYLARLSSTPVSSLGPIAAALQTSLDLLPADIQWCWRQLGTAAGNFSESLANALWHHPISQLCPPSAADSPYQILDVLDRASLLDVLDMGPEREPRFQLHDLARDYALHGLLEAGELDAAELAYADHVFNGLREANELHLAGHEGAKQGLAWLDQNWAHVQTMQRWAARVVDNERVEQLPSAERRLEICSRAPEQGMAILTLRLHRREFLGWLDSALQASRQLKDRRLEGDCLTNLGNVWCSVGEPKRAIDLHEKALAIARESGYQRGEGSCLCSLGTAWCDLGEPHMAIPLHEEALKIARKIGHRRGESSCLGSLGIAWCDAGQPTKAIEFHEQALAVAMEIGDPVIQGNHLGNLGTAWSEAGDLEKAVEFYERALAMAREIGDRRGEGNRLGSLGNAWLFRGSPSKALVFYEHSLAIARDIGDQRAEANRLFNTAIAEREMGATSRACDHLLLALEIYERVQSSDAQIVQRYLREWSGPPAIDSQQYQLIT